MHNSQSNGVSGGGGAEFGVTPVWLPAVGTGQGRIIVYNII